MNKHSFLIMCGGDKSVIKVKSMIWSWQNTMIGDGVVNWITVTNKNEHYIMLIKKGIVVTRIHIKVIDGTSVHVPSWIDGVIKIHYLKGL